MQTTIVRSDKFTRVEGLAYGAMAIVIAIGFYIARTNEDLFRNFYVPEDGVLEYFTSLMLFVIALVALYRLAFERKYHTKAFAVIYGITFVLMIFGAGEEISWGQRIFGIESTEYFLENNRQAETNLHNMEVNGVNINKLIFGKVLTLFLVSFYLILPSLYKRSAAVKGLFDRLYIPVPKTHHGLAMLIAALAILYIPSSKKGELNEVCLSIFFLLTVLLPQNKFVVSER